MGADAADEVDGERGEAAHASQDPEAADDGDDSEDVPVRMTGRSGGCDGKHEQPASEQSDADREQSARHGVERAATGERRDHRHSRGTS